MLNSSQSLSVTHSSHRQNALSLSSEKQNEEVKFLNNLAKNDGGTSHAKQQEILNNIPNWILYEKSQIIPQNSAKILTNFHALNIQEKLSSLTKDDNLCRILLRALSIESDIYPVKYVLAILYEAVRDDTTRYDSILEIIGKDEDIFHLFNRILERNDVDSYTADKSAFILSGFFSRATLGTFSDDQVKYFVQKMMQQHSNSKYSLSDFGKLDALVNILKISAYRKFVWETRGVLECIKKNLDLKSPTLNLYKAVFCVWLFSFNSDIFSNFFEKSIIKQICTIIKECRVEKVVRVFLHILRNMIQLDDIAEYVIDENIMQVLTLLEYEKWRDNDMYEEIRDTMYYLDQKIKHFSNFTRYVAELDKGVLKWSFLHSEKFWHENIMHFEQDEFSAIKKLVKLLNNSDSVTLAVACHDLGEFARLHPAGKRICENFKVKEAVMFYIGNKDRKLSCEALLCIQKLMLDKWQNVALNTNKS